MSEAINNVKQAFDAELAQTDLTNQEAVNNLRVKYLGKKGAVTDLMKQMGSLSAEERPAYGKLVNELKVAVSEAIDKAIETANQAALQKKLESGFVDTTLPGAGIPAGSTHPLYDVREEIIGIRFTTCAKRLSTSLARWVSRWTSVATSRRTGTTSRRSIRLLTTRAATCRTRSTWTTR